MWQEFARLDLGNVGGFTEAMKVAGLCEAHYIDLMPHNPCGPIMTAANNHYAAAIPNYGWLEDRPEYAGNPGECGNGLPQGLPSRPLCCI